MYARGKKSLAAASGSEKVAGAKEHASLAAERPWMRPLCAGTTKPWPEGQCNALE